MFWNAVLSKKRGAMLTVRRQRIGFVFVRWLVLAQARGCPRAGRVGGMSFQSCDILPLRSLLFYTTVYSDQ
jgi:hypothetical protein